MQKVTKVAMFVCREQPNLAKTGKCRKEFFVLHRKIGDTVVPTGHKEKNETLRDAVAREIQEELGVKPIKIQDLKYKSFVILKKSSKQGFEHAFLVQIPTDKKVRFLEADEKHRWHPLEDLPKILTYFHHQEAVKSITKFQ